MPRKRIKRRGPRGEGYVTWDKARSRWKAVVGRRSASFTERDAAEAWRRGEVARQREPAAAPEAPPARLVVEALADMIADRDWLAETTQTVQGYFAEQIAAHLGTLPIGDVTVEHIRAFDRAMRDRYVGARAAQILSYVGRLFKRLHILYPDEVRRDPVAQYLVLNPPRTRQGTPMREPTALDAGHCRLILQHVRPAHRAPLAWLMVLGLRVGELKGLRWANVRGGVAAIVEQRRPHDRFTPAPIKTEREIGKGRAIPVPDALLALVDDGDDLVFPNERDSGSISGQTLLTNLHEACDAAGIARVRLHDLRHTCATGLTLLGCQQFMVGAMLGHARKTQTEEYIDVTPAMLRPWVERWAGMVLGDSQYASGGNNEKHRTGT